MKYADSGKRVVAFLIDSFILYIVNFILMYLFSLSAYNGRYYFWHFDYWVHRMQTFMLLSLVSAVFGWLYYILMEGGPMHATLGKKIMGMYVADARGNGITYTTAILRLIGKIPSGMLFGIGYIMGLFSEQKQCLHDMIAKTYVLEGGPEYGGRGAGPKLIGVTGPLSGMIYNVTTEGITIGRDSAGCQVVVPASQAKVSRMHCVVSYNPISGVFILNDRGSTHGTFLLGGTRLSYGKPAALRSGDRFYLATTDNMFEVK